jgi:hypothetical protein
VGALSTGVQADTVREFRGHRVRIALTPAAGGGNLAGLVTGLLESADGLVLFLDTGAPPAQAIHYHYIADIADAA